MKKITLLILLLTVSFGYSQVTDLLQDFEAGGIGAAFGNLTSATAVADPAAGGTNGTVAQLITNTAGNTWQGVNIDITSNVELTSQRTMTIDVYSTTAISILVKVTASTDGGPDSSTAVSHTGSGWETLTATFDSGLDNTAAANGTYSNFVVYPNWDPNTTNFIDPPIDRTIYVDNITGKASTAGPDPAPTDAPAAPTASASDVTSLYSDTYSDVASNTTPGWTEVVSEEMIAGNNVYKTTNFLPFAITTPIDITPHTHLHVDIWLGNLPSAGAGLLVKLLDAANGPHEGNYTYPISSITEGAWNSIDIPIADFVQVGGTWDAAARASIDQVLVDIVDDAVMYVDNVYFYTEATASTDDNALFESKVYPNPASDAWTISTPNNTIRSVQVFNVLGKQVVSRSFDSNEATISVQSLASGIYIARVTTDAGTKTMKLMKE